MNIDKLEQTLKSLVLGVDKETFIYDFLRAYELPQASLTRLKKGGYNLSNLPGDVLWKKRVCFRVDAGEDLHALIDSLQNDQNITKHHPRFIIVTNFEEFLAVDLKTKDTLDIQFDELHKHYDFFLPWAGMEKSQLQSENPADIKAAERMGKLYDLILEDNPVYNDTARHALNVFLSRLLFCFFAEDTGIFKNTQFTNALASHTSDDGSDLQAYLQKLFLVLNTPDHSEFPKYLQDFPYVNGGLFAEDLPVPRFSAKSRRIILECGELNWKAINPDIFGSMIQAVIHEEMRGGLGMHYTSVTNIMKVIKPLFLSELEDELEKAGQSKTKLKKFLERIYNLKIFDPACGSGNFLIIAYKELCKLEIEAFKRFFQGRMAIGHSKIKLTQFYGIELDDFAHETAKLSMWLAEHQMNLAFKKIFGETRPTLPLQDGGNVVCANATRVKWEDICPKDDENSEIYILGNPPYLGGKKLSSAQSADMDAAGLTKMKQLDYIGCWFIKAANYCNREKIKFGFVSTSSVCQGEQVHLLWPYLFNRDLDLFFAYSPFKWSNNARNNAGVYCTIVGLRQNTESGAKYIFSEGGVKEVKNISPYLIEASPIIVEPRSKPMFDLPVMCMGSNPVDGKNLIFTELEYKNILKINSGAGDFLKRYMGGNDYMSNINRYCLWVDDSEVDKATEIPDLKNRIVACRKYRLRAGRDARKVANVPHRFCYRTHQNSQAIILPNTSSSNRNYIPGGFTDEHTVINKEAFAIYDADPYILGVVTSTMHKVWLATVGGRLGEGFRYSVKLVYNTFPFPNVSDDQKRFIEECTFNILDERELYSEMTLVELYDPNKMPDGLLKAHEALDAAVERCYRVKAFVSDQDRLTHLFKLYEEMANA